MVGLEDLCKANKLPSGITFLGGNNGMIVPLELGYHAILEQTTIVEQLLWGALHKGIRKVCPSVAST